MLGVDGLGYDFFEDDDVDGGDYYCYEVGVGDVVE